MCQKKQIPRLDLSVEGEGEPCNESPSSGICCSWRWAPGTALKPELHVGILPSASLGIYCQQASTSEIKHII